MLKWNYAINLGLAGVLTVPLLVEDVRPDSQADAASAAGLERTLGETLRALEVLSGIEKRTAGGDPRANTVVRHVTEAALGDARQRDQRLAALRDEVSALQMQSDGLDAPPQAGGTTPATNTGAALTPPDAGALFVAPITTGLCDIDRRALSLSVAPQVAAGTRSLTPSNAGAGPGASMSSARPAPEALAADPLRQGQACYRAGRYAECLSLMKSLGSDPRARYWTGRALERLDRITEAIAVYREVSAASDAGYLATRAAGDLDYLQWRVAVADRLAQKAEAAHAAGAKPAPKRSGEAHP